MAFLPHGFYFLKDLEAESGGGCVGGVKGEVKRSEALLKGGSGRVTILGIAECHRGGVVSIFACDQIQREMVGTVISLPPLSV